MKNILKRIFNKIFRNNNIDPVQELRNRGAVIGEHVDIIHSKILDKYIFIDGWR